MSKIKGLQAKRIAADFKEVFNRKGYSFYENGDYNLNIVSVRNKSGRADVFDDYMNVIYKIKGEWVVESYVLTTEPGVKILKVPIKEVRHKGTAILVPGQYKSTYRIGMHGRPGYKALIQRGGKVLVARDNNRDEKPDYHNPEEEGWFGINIHKHRGSDVRINTGGVSAGCQVFQSSKDFYRFMKICEQSKEKYGNSFTYTLLNEVDLRVHRENICKTY